MISRLHNTPLGSVTLIESAGSLVSCRFSTDKQPPYNASLGESAFLESTAKALSRYFNGELEALHNTKLEFAGTDFQNQVWSALREIPAGSTVSYSCIADSIGRPKASRAVGGACNKNRLLFFVPCHRVIGKNQSLTGFNGGIEKKSFLLDFESYRKSPHERH